MGLIVIVMSMMGPAFNAISGATGTTKAFYDMAGALEQARTYAQANNTYAFVGFAEMDAAQPDSGPQKPGIGRVFTASVASKDGTRGYDSYDTSANIQSKWKTNYGTGGRLVAVSSLRSYENLHIINNIPVPAAGPMVRPSLPDPTYSGFRVGNPKFISVTPFNWPLGTALNPTPASAGQIYFDKVFMFSPTGMASLAGGGSGQWFELGLQPTHGNVSPPVITSATATSGNYCAIMINGLTGAVRIYRP